MPRVDYWFWYLFLIGFPFAFGVFQDYYRTHEPFAGSSKIAVIGTTAMVNEILHYHNAEEISWHLCFPKRVSCISIFPSSWASSACTRDPPAMRLPWVFYSYASLSPSLPFPKTSRTSSWHRESYTQLAAPFVIAHVSYIWTNGSSSVVEWPMGLCGPAAA